MNPYLLTGIFIASAIVGYFLISHVPSLLHTPLMSGMNALSGLSAIGALAAAGMAVSLHNELLGGLAVVLAMVNIVGGFGVTERMLRMFKKGNSRGDHQ